MKSYFKITLVAAYILFVSNTNVVCEEKEFLKMKPNEQIVVNGDKVEFFEADNKIIAEGNVSIKYAGVVLTCDQIEVNIKSQKALCKGHVHIEGPEGVLTGDYIMYDFLNKKGEIAKASVDAFPWFAQAENTKRISENEFFINKGSFSTCDHDNQHYRVTAKEIHIFPNQKIIAKDAVCYLGNVPVLWVPYYYQPILESRAKVQFVPGHSSDWGYFLLSSWRFYLKGNTKADLIVDYRTKKGFSEGANLYYNFADFNMPSFGVGVFRSYFIHQNDVGTYNKSAFRDDNTEIELRKRFQLFHRVDFDPNTVGMVEFNKMSDEHVMKDYFYNEYEETNPNLPNYAAITTTQENFVFSANVEKRFNDFNTVAEKKPEFKLDIPNQRLWETPFYYTNQISATAFEKEYAFQSSPSEKVERMDSSHRISYVSKLGFLNLTPFGTFEETMYSANRYESDFLTREAFGGGLNASTRFSRIYDLKANPLGIEINDLRHIITPMAEYKHIHQPTVDKDSLYQMDDIDALEKQNGVTFALENKLQTKRQEGNDLVRVDLVRFITSTDYKFRMEKDEFKFKKEGQFKYIDFDLELSPYRWFYIDNELRVLPKNQSISMGSVEFSLRPTNYFNMDLGYRYQKNYPDDPRNQLTFDIGYRLNPMWGVGWYERLDLQSKDIEEQQFTLTRDLHCWEVSVSYSVQGSNIFKDEYTVWFAFKIKAFPDLPIGLNRSFEKRTPGPAKYDKNINNV
ncbi:Organic solvent tolerance protein OstA [Candidatus Omnitrophus magneticus]|uniref:Organic solvent tolerance protein OstA n=1 Tax=Candidatus Omnitrophus magneticus TaxID=1609969 RepID=A0A0F0CVL1_9BACT|nr:Organic solvent tolerance protein OstA [Candidatus Omnitrophus magneticus]